MAEERRDKLVWLCAVSWCVALPKPNLFLENLHSKNLTHRPGAARHTALPGWKEGTAC